MLDSLTEKGDYVINDQDQIPLANIALPDRIRETGLLYFSLPSI
jgi:hypothetical protein